ncbi:MAG: glycosyltransferase family 2 protein [Lachnospiraceae bacterium]|nr:glycosyltransferase family 2 protein [Lachnospiraceae bacterium]
MNSDICGDANSDTKKVQILMSTYNGEEYIREQLESILAQNYPDVDILIRDDGSKDDTFVILKEYEETHSNIRAYQGENVGVNKSFFELLKKSNPNAGYIGFCDQDDYWLPEKIERAVEKLETLKGPALYCGAKTLVDENLEPFDRQQDPNLIPGFGNAVIESICSGCTTLMNRELVDIIKDKLPEDVIHHDWWCYLVATYLGEVYFDTKSYIYYRQHGGNEVGASGTTLGMMKAKNRDLQRRQGDLKQQLLDFKRFYRSQPEKDELVDAILASESLSGRMKILFNRKWYRQSELDNWIVRGLFLIKQML